MLEREQDQIRRNKQKKQSSEIIVIVDDDNDYIELKKCIMCKKSYTMDKFLTSKGQISQKCNVLCLPKERDIDHKRDRSGRDYVIYNKKPERKLQKKQSSEIIVIIDDDNDCIELKKCIMCKKSYTMDKFLTSKGQISQKCNVICLPKKRDIDHKRDRSGRDYVTYDKNPERKLQKKEWINANPEKNVGYYVNARARKIEEYGIDEYHRMNNECAVNYRKNNPEKQKEFNKKRKVNVNTKYKILIADAKKDDKIMELSLNECTKMFLGSCYYCGRDADKENELNGIDRKDNDEDYILTNCVSACKLCNMMKGPFLDDINFIQICEHILTNLNIIDGDFYPNSFRNSGSSNYNEYIGRAKRDNIDFKLSESDFYQIVQNNCYLCNKPNTRIHNNGIDRTNNNLGYISYNCKACCVTCNYIKSAYYLYDVLNQMTKIFKHQCDSTINVSNEMIEKSCLLATKHYNLNKNIIDCKNIAKQRSDKHYRIRALATPKKIRNKLTKTQRNDIYIANKEKNKQKIIQKYTIEENKNNYIKNAAQNRIIKNKNINANQNNIVDNIIINNSDTDEYISYEESSEDTHNTNNTNNTNNIHNVKHNQVIKDMVKEMINNNTLTDINNGMVNDVNNDVQINNNNTNNTNNTNNIHNVKHNQVIKDMVKEMINNNTLTDINNGMVNNVNNDVQINNNNNNNNNNNKQNIIPNDKTNKNRLRKQRRITKLKQKLGDEKYKEKVRIDRAKRWERSQARHSLNE